MLSFVFKCFLVVDIVLMVFCWSLFVNWWRFFFFKCFRFEGNLILFNIGVGWDVFLVGGVILVFMIGFYWCGYRE